MSREIKFRALDTMCGRMFPVFELRATKSGELVVEDAGGHIHNHSYFILMQFTGLKDHNGKEIYEGDILESKFGHRSPVVFANGSFAIPGRREKYYRGIISRVKFGDVVVGNIHENPELLAASKEPERG
jgi:hypothetical protein